MGRFDKDVTETTQNVHFGLNVDMLDREGNVYKDSGLRCKNNENPDGCDDYNVRFCCAGTITQLTAGECASTSFWSKWYNYDEPTNTEDNESLSHIRNRHTHMKQCSVTGVQATLRYDNEATETKQNVHFGLNVDMTDREGKVYTDSGLRCKNKENPDGCDDYTVRFCCADADLMKCKLSLTTTGHSHAISGNTLRLSFRKDAEEVESVDLTPSGRWDRRRLSSSEDFYFLFEWDNLKVEQLGGDGINFARFEISCDNGKSLDLVKEGGCPGSLWFDYKDAHGLSVTTNDPCYAQGASQIKTATLKKKRDPLIRINKVHANYNTVLDELSETSLSRKPQFVKLMRSKIEKQVKKAIKFYERVNPKCNYWDEDEEEDDVQRYDREDPCKGVKQLATAVSKWANEFAIHCKIPGAGPADKIESMMKNIGKRLFRKMKC